MKYFRHLVSRFFQSLLAKPLKESEVAWLQGRLSKPLFTLWHRLSVPDQRHLLEVGKLVEFEVSLLQIDPREQEATVIAALFHDCGKIVSKLGTFQRVFATIYWHVLPSKVSERLVPKLGQLGVALKHYRNHPQLGSELLTEAEAPQLAIDWALQHHLSPLEWTVPLEIGSLLKQCDDD